MWGVRILRLQADEVQDLGGAHRAGAGGGPLRLEGEEREEHHHQYWVQLCL